jgi:hypothetical protein
MLEQGLLNVFVYQTDETECGTETKSEWTITVWTAETLLAQVQSELGRCT